MKHRNDQTIISSFVFAAFTGGIWGSLVSKKGHEKNPKQLPASDFFVLIKIFPNAKVSA